MGARETTGPGPDPLDLGDFTEGSPGVTMPLVRNVPTASRTARRVAARGPRPPRAPDPVPETSRHGLGLESDPPGGVPQAHPSRQGDTGLHLSQDDLHLPHP